MPTLQQFLGWMENKGLYMVGRFALGTALAWGGAFGAGSLVFAGSVLFAGTTALLGFNTWRKQAYLEADLLNTYRDEIAAKLGMSVEDVTKKQLHQVADGAPELNLSGNPVLKAELNRNGKRLLMEIGTTIGAVLTAVGVYLLIKDISFVKGGMEYVAEFFNERIGAVLGASSADKIGLMLASGTGMGVFNNIYDKTAERLLGLDVKSPTDLIRQIKRDLGRDQHISQEQVLGVYAAALPSLSDAIKDHFDQPYSALTEEQQYDALKIYGRNFPIEKLTHDINQGVIEPEELTFIAVGQTSGVPRKTIEQAQAEQEIEEEKTVADKVMETAKELLGADEEKDEKAEPASAPSTNFVERVSSHRPQADLSHVERLMKEDAAIIDQLPTLR